MSSLGLDTPPPADAQPPLPESELEPAHPPRRSFSQPQFPYQFGYRTAPQSAAPSIREAAIIRLTGRPSTAHARGTPQLGPGVFAPMCASARTSYTRVDQTAPGTPQPELAELSPSRYALEVDPETHDAGDGEHTDEQEDPEKADLVHEHHEQSRVPQMPQVALTFLTISGKRRMMSFDPETTIGRVKELVWNAWPNGELSFSTRAPLLPLPFRGEQVVCSDGPTPVGRTPASISYAASCVRSSLRSLAVARKRRPREIKISASSTHVPTHVASGKCSSHIGEAFISRLRLQA